MFGIKGACSNQKLKCIIYTSNINVGRNKLEEIEMEKKSLGIEIVYKKFSYCNNEIAFSDGEEWIITNPSINSKGCRWRKAWVDVINTSLYEYYNIILPSGNLYKLEEAKFFNWYGTIKFQNK